MPIAAAVFDLDGVIADTATLHRRSWERVAQHYGVPFDSRVNDRMRGLTRPESLRVFLEAAPRQFSPDEQREILALKQALYLESVAALGPDDALPGVRAFIDSCRRHGLRLAVASSSRNVTVVLERLGLRDQFDVVVDANVAPRSKPDPQAFQLAAERLGVLPRACVAIEDGQAGVDAARAAGMFVIGVGPPGRLRNVDRLAASLAEVRVEDLLALGPPARLDDLSVRAFLAALGSGAPTPGGGAAAAVCGGLAAALGRMVVTYTLGRPKFAAVEGEVASLDAELARAATLLAALVEEDSAAYAGLSAAMKLDRHDPGRAARVQEAAAVAGAVPLETAVVCTRVCRIAERLAVIANPMLRSDAHCARHFARAATLAALENVRVNLPLMTPAERALLEGELAGIEAALEPLNRS